MNNNIGLEKYHQCKIQTNPIHNEVRKGFSECGEMSLKCLILALASTHVNSTQ